MDTESVLHEHKGEAHLYKESPGPTLAGVAQLEHHPVHQKVLGLVPRDN